MQGICLQGLAVVLSCHPQKSAGAGVVDDNRQDDDQERPQVGVDMNGGAKEQTFHRLPDDPDTSAQEQHGLEERRQVLYLAVAVGMLGVCGSARNPHRPQRDHRRGQIQTRVQRLSHNTQAACP